MNDLGKYIAQQRLARRLSMRKLALLAHISHTEIHRLEAGERKHPSPLVLKAIAEALGINFNDIMEAAGYTHNAPTAPALQTLQAIFPGIEELDEKELEEVRDFINFLRSKKKLRTNTERK